MVTQIKETVKKIYEKIKEKIMKLYEVIKNFIKNTAEDFSIIDVEEGQARWSFNWWVQKSFKWITAIILAAAALFIWGCSTHNGSVKYYPVNIPVSCQIDMPEKPVYSENIVVTNLSILSYASKLESALKACRGDK